MGPQSPPAEFNSPTPSGGGVARILRTVPPSSGRGDRTFRGRSAATGSVAASSPGGRWPEIRVSGVTAPGGGPAAGPRNFPPRREPPAVAARPTGEDCSQCSPTAGGRTEPGPLASHAQGLRRIGRHPIRPVLKHGPRSLTCARVMGFYET